MSQPNILRRFDQFFSREEVPFGLAVARILLPLLLLLPLGPRAFHIREIYSSDGAASPIWENFQHKDLLPIPGGSLAVVLFVLYAASLVTSSLGLFTRLSLIAATIFNVYFGLLDCLSTMTKYTIISSHVLLLLSLSDCGALWSVDEWLRRRNGKKAGAAIPALPRSSPVWPRRLIQLFIGVVYLGAAATKVHTTGFFSGDQMAYWMMTNTNFSNPVGEYLSLFPGLVVAMAYVAIFWEMTFLFVCWKGTARAFALSVGAIFHVMTYFTLGLILFPMLYIPFYAAFFDEEDYLAARAWLSRVVPNAYGRLRDAAIWPWRTLDAVRPRWFGLPHAAAAVAVVTSTCAVVVVEIEKRADVFGVARAEGRFVLEPMSAQQTERVLRNDQGILPVDAVAGFDVGSERFGETLIDRRAAFRAGETAIVQCSLEPPHHDLWVEIDMHDADDHIVARDGVIIARESLRGSIGYKFDGRFPPGTYFFVLKIDGREITRREVTLQAE